MKHILGRLLLSVIVLAFAFGAMGITPVRADEPTPTETATATSTLTETETATATGTLTFTPTSSKTVTLTATVTPTVTITSTVTKTATPTVTKTPSPTATVAWSSFGSGLDYEVNDIAFSNSGDLYIGGRFNNAGSNPHADWIAKWNGTGWDNLSIGINGTVHALAISPITGDLYVGGEFTNGGYIAKWDGTTWSTLGPGLNDTVYDIAISSTGDIYAAGRFTDAGGDPNGDAIAKWNGSTWSAIGAGLGLYNLQYYVRAIAISPTGVIYAGGSTRLGIIAQWNGGNWTEMGSGIHGNNSGNGINSIAVDSNGTVYVGGPYFYINGDTNEHYIAKWDGNSWSGMGGSTPLTTFVDDILISDAGDIYVNGRCYYVDPYGACKVAKWDGINWLALGPELRNGSARIMAIHGADMYVGGSFTSVDGNPNGQSIVRYSNVITTSNATNTPIPTLTPTASATITSTPTVTATGATATKTATPTFTKTITRTPVPPNGTLTFVSMPTEDGWIKESFENSSVGGTFENGSGYLHIGDGAGKEQERAILSFDTSSLPDNATITSVLLKVKQLTVTYGANPVTLLDGFMADIRTGSLGVAALQALDFQQTADSSYGPFLTDLVDSWYTLDLTDGQANINKTTVIGGLTQIRLRFVLDDNDDWVGNYIVIASGNALTAEDRPQLIVQYSTP